MKTLKKLISVFSILLLMGLASYAYYKAAHMRAAEVAIALLQKLDQDKKYGEIYAETNKNRIIAGSWQEDEGAIGGHDRAFRHYWDPDRDIGVAWFDYYRAIAKFQPGSKATMPENSLLTYARAALDHLAPGIFRWHYPGAREWAKNGAGSGDLRNWEGAIKAYSYSAASRSEAYRRLGHVVHLLTDMAEPDHTANVPHGASGFYYPRDLQMISAYVKDSAPSVANNQLLLKAINRLRRQMEIKSWDDKKTTGYEQLIELNVGRLFPQVPNVQKNKRPAFDTYFSVMGGISKAAVQGTSDFPLPLGVSFLPEQDQNIWLTSNDNLKNYSFFPSINLSDQQEIDKFVNLARTLLTSAVRLNVGLLEYFHDIVDPPPYVRSVEISQEKKPRYHSWWKDVRENRSGQHVDESLDAKKDDEKARKELHYNFDATVGRIRETDNSLPGYLEPGKAATIRIEFGPKADGFEYPPEKMKRAVVRVADGVADEIIPGRLVDKDSAWVGQFTPELEEGENEQDLQLEVSAWDVHNHVPNRWALSNQEVVDGSQGYQLDSEPEHAAKAESTSPYDWQRYFPGNDNNHLIKVKKEGTSGFSLFMYSVYPDETGLLNSNVGLSVGSDLDRLTIIRFEDWHRVPAKPKETRCILTVTKGDSVETQYIYPNSPQSNRVTQGGSLMRYETVTGGANYPLFGWAIRKGETRSLKLTAVDGNGRQYEAECVFRHGDWVPDPENGKYYKRRDKKK